MKQKLDAEDFDALRQLVHSMASGSLRQPLDKREANQSSNLPTKEINAIRDLERRVGDLTLTLANLVHLSPESIEEILIKVRRIEQKLSNKAEQSEVDDINSKIEDLVSRVAEINILIQTVNVKQDTSEAPKPNKAAENSLIASLNRRVHSLEENIKSFRLPHGIDLFQVWEEIKKL